MCVFVCLFSLLYGLSPVTGPQVGKHYPSDAKVQVFFLYRNWNDEKLTEETVEEKEKINCILHFCSLSSCSQIPGWDVVLVCHQRPALAGRNC